MLQHVVLYRWKLLNICHFAVRSNRPTVTINIKDARVTFVLWYTVKYEWVVSHKNYSQKMRLFLILKQPEVQKKHQNYKDN